MPKVPFWNSSTPGFLCSEVNVPISPNVKKHPTTVASGSFWHTGCLCGQRSVECARTEDLDSNFWSAPVFESRLAGARHPISRPNDTATSGEHRCCELTMK